MSAISPVSHVNYQYPSPEGRPTRFGRGGYHRRGCGWKNGRSWNQQAIDDVTHSCEFCQQLKDAPQCISIRKGEIQQAATEPATQATSATASTAASECTCNRYHQQYYRRHHNSNRNPAAGQDGETTESGNRHPRRQWRDKRGGESESGRRSWRESSDQRRRGNCEYVRYCINKIQQSCSVVSVHRDTPFPLLWQMVNRVDMATLGVKIIQML